MGRLLKNCKGAVTVMVTLLLIPSILVSGTGVDIARIYTTRSIVEDANQLAANSVLASYEALLQDLYGLYGFLNDGNLKMDQYVQWATRGSDWDKGMGTFQIFYGSDIQPPVLTPAKGQNLGNVPVFRRQIEEYSKFRAPAIIAELLMDKLDVFNKIQEDAKVIKKKLEVDDGVEELEKYYKKIYNHIVELENVQAREDAIMQDISSTAESIQTRLGSMKGVKAQYKAAYDEYQRQKAIRDSTDDEDVWAAAQRRMEELQEEMDRLEMEYGGYWELIQRFSKALADHYNKYETELKHYLSELDGLQRDCKTAEEKKEELRKKIQELRTSLESGKCSTTLRDGMMEPEADDGLSMLERYEALLRYNIEDMGNTMRDHDDPQIRNTLKIMQEARLGGILLVRYRDVNRDAYFPLKPPDSTDIFDEALSDSTSFTPYVMPNGRGYMRFEEFSQESQEFWGELRTIYDSEKGAGANKTNLEKSVSKVMKKAQDTFQEMLGNFVPEGAKKLDGALDTSSGAGSKFGTEGKWKDKDEGKKEMEESLDSDFLGKLANTASEAGNKLLLVVYDTEMFSDYSTAGLEDEGYPEENMAGVLLSVDVNYYFQSELEYLYNGNLADAEDNLKSVAGMMFLIRFVLDYVASFTIPEVNHIVNGVKSALAWTGPFSILAGELARLGLSIGEASLDAARLREGEQVVVFKGKDTWKLSLRGLIESATKELTDDELNSAFNVVTSSDTGSSEREGDEGITMGYRDYMRIFLLLVPGDTLARRTQNLVDLNVTNYDKGLKAIEEDMAKAERYDLDKLITGFSLTTSVDMRMLFLSMPFAQKGANGVIPPKTLTITATDYRGY